MGENPIPKGGDEAFAYFYKEGSKYLAELFNDLKIAEVYPLKTDYNTGTMEVFDSIENQKYAQKVMAVKHVGLKQGRRTSRNARVVVGT